MPHKVAPEPNFPAQVRAAADDPDMIEPGLRGALRECAGILEAQQELILKLAKWNRLLGRRFILLAVGFASLLAFQAFNAARVWGWF